MSGHAAATVGNNSQVVLRNNIARIKPLLDLEGEWTVRDAEGDVRDVIVLLKKEGAIEHVSRDVFNVKVHPDDPSQGSDIVNRWRWKPAHKRYLKQVAEDVTTFPCGHRAHICNPREVDGFSCRKCLDDGDTPEYSREQLEELGVV